MMKEVNTKRFRCDDDGKDQRNKVERKNRGCYGSLIAANHKRQRRETIRFSAFFLKTPDASATIK